MTQGTWIALTVIALFIMNVIAKGDLPKYKAVLLGTGQSGSTPSPEGASSATTAPLIAGFSQSFVNFPNYGTSQAMTAATAANALPAY